MYNIKLGSNDVALRNLGLDVNNSLIKEILIYTTPTEIMVGVAPLEGRRTIYIRNLASDYVWLGLHDDIGANDESFLLYSGEGIVLPVNPMIENHIYAIASQRNVHVEVIETTCDALTFAQRIPSNRPYTIQYLYSGRMFAASHKFTIPINTTVYIQAKTALGNRLMHVIKRQVAFDGGPIDTQVLEGPFDTLTDGVTPMQVISNMDRRSTINPVTLFYVDPTNISGGILFDIDYVIGGSGLKPAGAFETGASERVLKPGTDYILTFENLGAQAAVILVTILWFESLE